MCHCDSVECQAAGKVECKAEFYCYVSFRPAEPGERKPSATSKAVYGFGSRLFIAEHRGCVAKTQINVCDEHGESRGVGSSSGEEVDGSARQVIRCCRNNWCNMGQELEFTKAELDGRQFFLNPGLSDLEPGLSFPMFSAKSSVSAFRPLVFTDEQGTIGISQTKKENPVSASTQDHPVPKWKSPLYTSDLHFNGWFGHRPALLSPSHAAPGFTSEATATKPIVHNSVSKKDKSHLASSAQQQEEANRGGQQQQQQPPIALQPLHIAVGVCLIILMLVAVLLHIVIVLYRRHRRLKRELLKQTQIPGTDQSHWPLNTVNTSTQSGQRIDLQHLKYATVKAEQRQSAVEKINKGLPTEASPANVYEEVLPHQVQLQQCLSSEPYVISQTPVLYHSVLTSTGSFQNSLPSPPLQLNSAALNHQNAPSQLVYSPHSLEHTFHPGPTKNMYCTSSSVSNESGNNPSTTESSLPTQSSTVACWNTNNNSNHSALQQNDFSNYLRTNQERPSLSGSSEAGILTTPDFESRRANVALPPALLKDAVGPSLPPQTTTGLAMFRSAAPQNDACSMVTPYAQFQLSLSFDQYDTPEQIFANGNASAAGSTSLDGLGGHNQTSSNPTTNSSLLHSYCEHGGPGDFRI
ncbi:unnamed protein product [Mesocestoides corti]|uniref:Uncharacterized protein n=1 Tax=Mesocestoides corti TaxID=53468 RepID=A0A158QV12_MESCO|nr:unnamed protein product [Mesocestoides corti]